MAKILRECDARVCRQAPVSRSQTFRALSSISPPPNACGREMARLPSVGQNDLFDPIYMTCQGVQAGARLQVPNFKSFIIRCRNCPAPGMGDFYIVDLSVVSGEAEQALPGFQIPHPPALRRRRARSPCGNQAAAG